MRQIKGLLFLVFLSVGTEVFPVFSQQLPQNETADFSLIVMSDTQRYLGKGTKLEPNSRDSLSNPILLSQTKWIVENLKKEKVAFVSHAGDLVDINNTAQWELASRYMAVLHGKVPYAICPGNHDMTAAGNSSFFQTYFPAEKFRGFDWYGGSFEGKGSPTGNSLNNANSYQLFSAGGVKFVILHLECNAPDSVLQWADSVLQTHAGRFAIVTTHMYLGPRERPKTSDGFFTAPKGVMQWTKCHGEAGNTAEAMWEKCFRKHRNLQIIFSGDQSRSNAMYLAQKGDHGNTVHAILNDYNATNHGAIRIYRFDVKKQEVEVISYDTINNRVVAHTDIVKSPEAHNFRFAVKF
jgi:3',5'-cyclic AMP phosphodiesterase CpdA